VPHAVVDVSALIARLDRNDTAHERCVDALSRIRDSLTTVWPALTGAMHLLADTRGGPDAPCTMVSDGVLTLLDLAESDLARVTSSPSIAI
jgi:predicted nucleic acid-binding protein